MSARKYGHEGLPDDTITFSFRGSAGQSFGAFLAHGVTLTLEGDANDYVGKGLSGGRIAVFPPAEASFLPENNIVAGNVICYGAVSGEAFFKGVVGERFCVRNSGASAVAEGCGDHGCEYMTGGRVVILGRTGRNFAAGMSGGIAYVYDEDGSFSERCNTGMAGIEGLLEEDEIEIRNLLSKHLRYTGSTRAALILEEWKSRKVHFRKVMPVEYRRVLDTRARNEERERIMEERMTAGV